MCVRERGRENEEKRASHKQKDGVSQCVYTCVHACVNYVHVRVNVASHCVNVRACMCVYMFVIGVYVCVCTRVYMHVCVCV